MKHLLILLFPLFCNAQTTARELYNEMQRQGVLYPEVFMQVARCEAGYNLNSFYALKYNNYFGLRCGRARLTTCQGEIQGHAVFGSMQLCVADLKHWQDQAPPLPGESPYAWLVRRQYNPKGWAYIAYIKSISITDLIFDK